MNPEELIFPNSISLNMAKMHLFVTTISHPLFSQAIGFTLFKSSSVSKTMKRGLQE